MLNRRKNVFLARRKFNLLYYSVFYLFCVCFAVGEHDRLTIFSVFCLRKHICCHRCCVCRVVCNNCHFRRTCRHINCSIFYANKLFCCHHKLVARTKDFINLRHAVCAICHSTNSLNATYFKYFLYSRQFCCIKNSWVYLSFCIWRGTKNYFFTTCNVGWNGKHKHSREEWGSATWHI